MLRVSSWLMAIVCAIGGMSWNLARGGEPAAKPLAGHPGNIFLVGEKVVVAAPKGDGPTWQLLDYEGRVVKEGPAAEGPLDLGELPVGYYELKRGGGERMAIGVLVPLQVRPSPASPIGVDVAMSWFYRDEPQMIAAANLCALAGVNWVRDRLNWGEMEPQKGQFAAANRYDQSAKIQSAAGLRVLQVNHISPEWAGGGVKRFPPDLRDAYRFYREMARRWKGQVLAFEPWNEADIDVFGGHTGAEMASLQKAAYLGLKAGNPEAIGCLNVFALSRKAQQEDLAANEAWAYFDTCNLHHYIPLEQYPTWYASFREISAGRPMWVTEFSMPVQWSGDEKAQELSDEMLRVQAERVPMVFAASLHEGTEAAFYFLLPHYVEGKTQFGILRKDLTPRPAYLALAAAGRLLAEAKPIGRSEDRGLVGYAFRAKPDGQECDVIVAWKTGEELDLGVPNVVAVFDHLGRPVPVVEGRVRFTRRPIYIIQPAGAARVDGKTMLPAASRPARKEGKVSPVVLQATWPAERLTLQRSAYRISSLEKQSIPVFVYNFGDRPAKGKLAVSGPAGWKVQLAGEVEIPPGERMELALAIECGGATEKPVETIAIRGDFGEMGQAVLSVRLQPEPAKVPEKLAMPVNAAGEVDRWQQEISGGSTLKLSARQGGGVVVEAAFGPGDRWVYPRLDFQPHERPTAEVTALHLKLSAVEGATTYRVIFVEEDGASYIAEPIVQPKPGETVEAVVMLSEAILGAGWSPPDPNGRLDVPKIKAIKIGGNTSAEKVRYEVSEVKWVKW